ncbi:hypothetical protein BCR34DRAFT_602081 [Clohesyomyces aquaticus]|uniref:Uncharacterized protein n=1 Tax=Clohesyomyces aquaticus TaxID=1231657 RepID=A0A1Y1ZJU0_9PLEO|nr:hypothetical protein BCR34DRAFT_602081 [Clohesyomyces aquaticus]
MGPKAPPNALAVEENELLAGIEYTIQHKTNKTAERPLRSFEASTPSRTLTRRSTCQMIDRNDEQESAASRDKEEQGATIQQTPAPAKRGRGRPSKAEQLQVVAADDLRKPNLLSHHPQESGIVAGDGPKMVPSPQTPRPARRKTARTAIDLVTPAERLSGRPKRENAAEEDSDEQ